MGAVSIEQVLQQEFQQVETARRLRLTGNAPRPAAKKSLIGLAFSGGGIRSATFNLGVLQALAQARLLHTFDYVSTVSGGGYIGSWLMAWMHHQQIGIADIETRLAPHNYSTASAADPTEVHFLRNYSNYLTPRKGILGADFWAFVATYVRNTLLNLMILVLLLLSGLLLPRVLVYLPNQLENLEDFTNQAVTSQVSAVCLGLLLAGMAVVFIGFNLAWVDPHTCEPAPWYAKQWAIQVFVVIPLIVSAALVSYGVSHFLTDYHILENRLLYPPILGMAVYFALWTGAFVIRQAVRSKNKLDGKVRPTAGLVLITSAVTGAIVGYVFIPYARILIPPGAEAGVTYNLWHIFTFGAPAFVGMMLAAGAVHVGLMGTGMSDSHREWWARLGGWMMIYTICWLLLFTTAVYIPMFLTRLWAAQHQRIFTSGTLFWLLSTLYGVLFGKSKETNGLNLNPTLTKKILGYVARLTPYIFIAGLLFALSLLAARITQAVSAYPTALTEFPPDWVDPAVPVTCLVLFVAAVILSWRVNVNEFSIHHAYRNRLVRCYLGASVKDRTSQPFTGFSEKDDLPLSSLQIPPDASEAKYGRPLPILNTSLNVVRGKELALQTRKARSFAFTPLWSGFTRETIGGSEWQSAFARTRESGSIQAECEEGIGLGTAVAISGAAASPNMGFYSQPALAFLMTLFDVRLGWWIGNPIKENKWRHGGPAIGFYWLLRELMGSTSDDSEYVYLSDGGHFENLAIYELVRRGCKVIVAGDASCDLGFGLADLHNAIERCRTDFGVEIELDPSPLKRQEELSQAHFVVGKIHYSSCADDDGVIVYMKPALVAGDPGDVLGYPAINPSFPDDTTANQWFDETHFENYRALGYATGIAAAPTIQEVVRWALEPAPRGAASAA